MIVIHNLNTLDISYDIGYLSTATNLEPLLGVCVACVPICRPLLVSFHRKVRNASASVLSRVGITSTSDESKHPKSLSGNEGVIVTYGRPSKHKNFRRLDDSVYQMTDLAGTTRCEGSGNHGSPESMTGSNSNQEIVVTDTWNVAIESRQ